MNTDESGGGCLTIKANYWKMSYANLIRDDGRKTTFIMKIEG